MSHLEQAFGEAKAAAAGYGFTYVTGGATAGDEFINLFGDRGYCGSLYWRAPHGKWEAVIPGRAGKLVENIPAGLSHVRAYGG